MNPSEANERHAPPAHPHVIINAMESTTQEGQPVVQVVRDQLHRTLFGAVTSGTAEWIQVPGRIEFMFGYGRLLRVAGKRGGDSVLLDNGQRDALPPMVPRQAIEMGDMAREALTRFAEVHHADYLNALAFEEMLERFKTFQPRARWNELAEPVDAALRERWARIADSPELKALATRGYDLFNVVFGTEGSAAELLRELDPGTRLIMRSVDAEDWVTHVPWGLIYRGNPDLPPNPDDFLGLGFRLEHGREKWNDYLVPPSDASVGNILFWGGGGRRDEPATIEAERQRSVLERWVPPKQLFRPEIAGQGNVDAVISFLRQPEPCPVLLYLYGHTESGADKVPALRLGQNGVEGEWQRIGDLDLGRTPFSGHPLVFINACSSSNGSGGYRNRFAAVFRERQCNAYIGTEAAVPAVLASHVAILFFHLFYRHGVEIPIAAGEALVQVRRFLWEEYRNIGGLFYSYLDKYDVHLADEEELLRHRSLRTVSIDRMAHLEPHTS